ncbi:thiamine pyrophosphate-binding protein, partial [Campylobacter coli]|nr:thiamine pyrophosphate-binding protein [Campylobacter coli]EIL2869273.1 thiamine pyrophosphate-binding protein [Campylobacter coli]
MKASDFLVNFLILNKIDKVFGYIGGAVAHIYDSISKNPNLEIINGIHEQGSAFAAEGYARVTGKSGVVIATSGPGATNLITTIGSCYFDSIPLLCITGQVNTYEFNYNKISRQIGFQETDIVEIVKPITKYAVMVNKIEDLRYELEKAYYISHFQRKGPVLVDIPMNIQRSEFDFDQAKSFFKTKEYLNMQNYYITSNNLSIKQIKHIASKISKAKSPIVLVGGGVRNSNACEILDFFLKKYNLPVVHSLMGKDAIESGFELNLGLIGSYGNRCANLALANSDVILVLGSRLDTRQTGTDLKLFAKNSEIIQVDIDNNELGKKILTKIQISSDIKLFLDELIKQKIQCKCIQWRNWVKNIIKTLPNNKDIYGNIKIENFLISIISKKTKAPIFCIDVGQHQMWAAQALSVLKNTRILFSGGMGAMGFSLPCAIGACIASNQPVVVIVGDGGFQMNIQELEVIKRRNLPIKIFIFNNENLGMVRQFQEIYFDKNYIGTIKDYSAPNFESVAKAYGIQSRTIENLNIFDQISDEIFSNNQPEVVNILLNNKLTNVEPKLIVGKPIEDMYPFIE